MKEMKIKYSVKYKMKEDSKKINGRLKGGRFPLIPESTFALNTLLLFLQHMMFCKKLLRKNGSVGLLILMLMLMLCSGQTR